MNKIFTDAHEWSGYFYGHSRDLTVEDFEFKEARVSGAHSIYGDRPPKSATANIAFYLKEELVAELEEATGNRRDGVRNHFMHFSDRKMFYVAINIDIKYNGCRSQGTKITKFLKVCSELEGQWKESADGLVSERVAEINKSWQETLERARGEYVGQYAAHLSKCDSYAMDVLDDEAGNLENLKKLEDLRKEVQTLNKEIHRAMDSKISNFLIKKPPDPQPSTPEEKELFWAKQVAEICKDNESRNKANEVVGYMLKEGLDVFDIIRAVVVLSAELEREKLRSAMAKT
jgi:hypothetical protein